MKVTLTLKTSGFFFVGDLSLSSKAPVVEVDLTGKSDNFIVTVINSTLYAKLAMDKDPKELIPLIKDKNTKVKMAKRLGIAVTESVIKEVEPEVVAIAEPVVEAPVVAAVEVAVETGPSESDILGNLLSGGTKKTVEAVTKAGLSKDELAKLLELEMAGKDRSAVKAVITDLIG